jgi:hypothetical protein
MLFRQFDSYMLKVCTTGPRIVEFQQAAQPVSKHLASNEVTEQQLQVTTNHVGVGMPEGLPARRHSRHPLFSSQADLLFTSVCWSDYRHAALHRYQAQQNRRQRRKCTTQWCVRGKGLLNSGLQTAEPKGLRPVLAHSQGFAMNSAGPHGRRPDSLHPDPQLAWLAAIAFAISPERFMCRTSPARSPRQCRSIPPPRRNEAGHPGYACSACLPQHPSDSCRARLHCCAERGVAVWGCSSRDRCAKVEAASKRTRHHKLFLAW